MFELTGKVALVTGANYGIGFAIAKGFAKAGAKICFNGINKEHLENALVEYKKLGIDAHGYICDCTDEPGVQKMIEQIKQDVGDIDILVNN